MTLADRLNQIIEEQKLSQREFAKRIGVSENYLYILTGNSRRGSDKKQDDLALPGKTHCP